MGEMVSRTACSMGEMVRREACSMGEMISRESCSVMEINSRKAYWRDGELAYFTSIQTQSSSAGIFSSGVGVSRELRCRAVISMMLGVVDGHWGCR